MKLLIIILSFASLHVYAQSNIIDTCVGSKISRHTFMQKINRLNKVLEKKDTASLSDEDCIEIIKISNTLTIYRADYINWYNKKDKNKAEIAKFLQLINVQSDFGRELFYYLQLRGRGTMSGGMGTYYKKYDIYSTGRVITNKSFYDIR